MLQLKPPYLFLLLVVILLTGAWVARTQLSELVASSTMNNHGLSESHVEIRQLGPGHSHIAVIRFQVKTDTGTLSLVAQNLDIHYTPQQLVHGRLEKLVLGELILIHAPGSESPPPMKNTARVTEPIKLLAMLRQAVREYIIIDSFTVQRIIMQGEYAGILRNKPLHLEGNNAAGKTYAEFTLLEQGTETTTEASPRLIINDLSQDGLSAVFSLNNTDDPPAAELQLNFQDKAIDGRYRINSRQLANWLQPFSKTGDLAADGEISGTASLELEPGREIMTTFSAVSDQLTINTLHADNAMIRLNISMPGLALDSLELTDGSFVKSDHFASRAFSLDNARFNLTGELSGSGGERMFRGTLESGELSLNVNSSKLKLDKLSSSIRLGTNRIRSEGTLSISGPPGRLSYRAEHTFADRSGTLEAQTMDPLDLDGEHARLSQILTPWPYGFDLYTGYIHLASHATWETGSRFDLSARIKLEESGGSFGELVFSRLSFEHELQLLPSIYSSDASMIRIKHIDSGVTASNVNASLKLLQAETGDLPQLSVANLAGNIFDGAFSAKDFIYDFNSNNNAFTLDAENIDLAQVVATQQFQDISVSGRIGGTLPIEIDDSGISVKQGAFLNDIRPGTIRYNPASAGDQLKQNPLTSVAMDALRDFRYSQLSADVNFTPQGMLKINLQLKGTSQELDTERPVHLNINTEQNLLSLLKSLRYAEGVSAVIDKKVRRQYESNRNGKAE